MKLYNTLTKRVEKLSPLNPDQIGIYSCGPTVYDHIHIGNLSSFIFADTLRRVLLASGQKVKHVMNFTDVDDKTIQRSQEKYPDLEPMPALLTLTKDYGEVFLNDMKAVGNSVTDINFVKATDSIVEMQNLIAELHRQEFAYIADDGVYFSIEAYKSSGKKYGQLTEITASSTSEARIQNDEYDKDSVHDFALWKKQKTNEPVWAFELDGQQLDGRPGWHIECSAMCKAALGQPFDIHTGGVDLIFPHHENEIAQSTAGQDNPVFAQYFAHNEHLLVEGKKMSKSLKNFFTLKDIIDKGYEPLAFRLLVLQAHYKSQAHFSWQNLEAAQNRLSNLRAIAALQHQPSEQTEYDQSTSIERSITDMQDAALNDLNTPGILAAIATEIDEYEYRGVMTGAQDNFKRWLHTVDDLLGLQLSAVQDISDDQKQLLEAREQAREAKDWAKSDDFRDQLAKQGVGLRDTAQGAIWYRL